VIFSGYHVFVLSMALCHQYWWSILIDDGLFLSVIVLTASGDC